MRSLFITLKFWKRMAVMFHTEAVAIASSMARVSVASSVLLQDFRMHRRLYRFI